MRHRRKSRRPPYPKSEPPNMKAGALHTWYASIEYLNLCPSNASRPTTVETPRAATSGTDAPPGAGLRAVAHVDALRLRRRSRRTRSCCDTMGNGNIQAPSLTPGSDPGFVLATLVHRANCLRTIGCVRESPLEKHSEVTAFGHNVMQHRCFVIDGSWDSITALTAQRASRDP